MYQPNEPLLTAQVPNGLVRGNGLSVDPNIMDMRQATLSDPNLQATPKTSARPSAAMNAAMERLKRNERMAGPSGFPSPHDSIMSGQTSMMSPGPSISSAHPSFAYPAPVMQPATSRPAVVDSNANKPKLSGRGIELAASDHRKNPYYVPYERLVVALQAGLYTRFLVEFDEVQMRAFISKIQLLFANFRAIRHLHVDASHIQPEVLEFMALPNIFKSLPLEVPSLTIFEFSTSLGQLVHWDQFCEILVRVPFLKHLMITGARFPAPTIKFKSYIPFSLEYCKLRYVDLRMENLEDMWCRSGKSMKMLHIEALSSISRNDLALCIASSLTSLVGLTIIVPDGERHLSNIGDDIMAAPLGTITTLILGGWACSEVPFDRKENIKGRYTSVIPVLTDLHLYDCRGLSLQRIITLIDRRWESPVLSQFGFSMPNWKGSRDLVLALLQACEKHNVVLTKETKKWAEEMAGIGEADDRAARNFNEEIDAGLRQNQQQNLHAMQVMPAAGSVSVMSNPALATPSGSVPFASAHSQAPGSVATADSSLRTDGTSGSRHREHRHKHRHRRHKHREDGRDEHRKHGHDKHHRSSRKDEPEDSDSSSESEPAPEHRSHRHHGDKSSKHRKSHRSHRSSRRERSNSSSSESTESLSGIDEGSGKDDDSSSNSDRHHRKHRHSDKRSPKHSSSRHGTPKSSSSSKHKHRSRRDHRD